MLKIFRSIVLKQTKRVSLCFRGISASSYSHLNASFGLLTLVPSRYFATQKPHTSHISLLKNHHSYDGFSVSQFYIGCLSIYAYVISSGKDCFIVDPDNDVSVVEKFIKEHNFKVKGIFLSHYHADYVAGHHELMNKYHCKTYMGPVSKASENIVTLKDGELLKLGDATIKLIHTPGHTEQSSCLLVLDRKKNEACLLTGDTLFLNEVGRPDLAVKTYLSAIDLSRMLFDSIQKIQKINDVVVVYPGHGSGSACGKSIGSGDFCTLGIQKITNYGFTIHDREVFSQKVLESMPKPPAYFGYNANINKNSPFSYEEAAKTAFTELTAEQVNDIASKENVVILDVRAIKEIKQGVISNSIFVGFEGNFANWIGTLFSPTEKFIIYGNSEQAKGAVNRLLRIGFTNVIGFASFDLAQWKNKGFASYCPEFAIAETFKQKDITVLDVRECEEGKQCGVVPGTVLNVELSELMHDTSKLNKQASYVVHCKSGYRAKIAYSFLRSKGFTNVKLYPTSFDSIFSDSFKKVETQ